MNAAAMFVLASVLAAEPESSPNPGMPLREAVSYALEHSPLLKAAEAEVTRRQGLVTTARSPLLPQLDLSADAQRTRFDRGYPPFAEPSSLRFDTALYTGVAELKLMAWDFQKTALELSAAKERVEAARASADRRRQEVVFETARLFLQTMAYSDLAEAAQSRITSLQALLDRTTKLVEGGRAVPVDALKIQTRLAQVESDLASLNAGRRSSLSALAAVMGYAGDLPVLAYAPPSARIAPVPTDENELLRQAEACRTEFQEQDREIRAGERAEKAIHKSALPRLDLRATVMEMASNSPAGFTEYVSIPSLPKTAAPENAVTDWVVGIRVSFSLFDGGRRKGQIQTAQAQLQQLRLVREQTKLRVDREVRTALADLESAESRVRALRDSVAECERILENEKLKFEAGRTVVNFVLDAEAALLTSQSLLSQAQRSVGTASLALDLSVGVIDVERWRD